MSHHWIRELVVGSWPCGVGGGELGPSGAGYRVIPFEPYAPAMNPVLAILRAVNCARKMAGFGPVPLEALWLRRRALTAFEPWEDREGEAV